MLNELDGIFKKFLNNQNVSAFKSNGRDLLDKYNDPKFDKLVEARRNVKDVKIQVGKNIEQILENNQDLEDLEEGARDMRQGAQQFETNAKKLERALFWKKIRLFVLIGVIIVVVIVVIILLAKFL